ncbi:golgin family A protein [Wolffia australiana]
MEGVGARLGRSSTRYGPTTVFTGPVRKWKKQWVPSGNNNGGAGNGSGNSAAHLVLYKWTLASAPSNGPAADKGNTVEETPRRKFRYVPVYVMEEEPKGEETTDTEEKPKLDLGDTAMVEPIAEDEKKPNPNTDLDLSLGLSSHDA